MKKILILLLSLIAVFSATMSLNACGKNSNKGDASITASSNPSATKGSNSSKSESSSSYVAESSSSSKPEESSSSSKSETSSSSVAESSSSSRPEESSSSSVTESSSSSKSEDGNTPTPEPEHTSQGLEFELNDDGKSYSVIGIGSCTDYDVIIPSTYNNLPVTSIGNNAFNNTSKLTSVKIPDSVTKIGAWAFNNCSELISATIENGIKSIGYGAFYNCNKLTYNEYENGLYLGNETNLYLCLIKSKSTSITSFTINNNCKIIYYKAFEKCKLTSISFPDSVTNIGSNAFDGCTGLTNITIPASVTSIDSGAFSGCSSLNEITIPYVGNRAGLTANDVYQYPFGHIFGRSSYTGGVKTLQQYYGSYTNDTTYDTIYDTIYDVFYIPSSLKKVTVMGGNILRGAFSDCTSLTNIILPESVTSIGDNAFDGCTGLTSITIPTSVTSIGSRAFSGCSSLTNITIPNSMTSIGDNAFNGFSGLTSITIPDSVTSIGRRAFIDCGSLTSITIPTSVTSIGSLAFDGCSSLTNVYYTGTASQWAIIDGLNNIMYKIALYINNKELTEVTLEGITEIKSNAFSYCTNLTSVVIHESVTSIGSNAFSHCSNLTSVVIHESVTSIGSYAFLHCSSLTSIVIPDGVTSIGSYAFSYCEKLTEITIPDSVTRIDGGVFGSCSSLNEITIPFVGDRAGVTANDTYQFPFGYLFSEMSYTGGVKTLQQYYGSSTNSIDRLTCYIPSSLKKVTVMGGNILYHAFESCSTLTSIVIPNSITSIEECAFV